MSHLFCNAVHCFLYVSFVIADLSFSDITRTLKPPYLQSAFNPYYVPEVTTEAFIPEIIVNRNIMRDDFNPVQPNVRQSDSFFPYLNNSYLPPPSNRPPLFDTPETTQTTRPPISFDPINTPSYIPPTVSQVPQNDIPDDFLTQTTLNANGYKYLPPTQQTPAVQQDVPDDDAFVPPSVTAPSLSYLPSQSKARELRDELTFSEQPNPQLQLELNELRCLPNIGGYFRAILSIQNFVQGVPVIENDVQDIRCDLQMVRNKIVISIASVDFRRCGVENCGPQQLCLRIRFPQIQGLRTLADPVLTLQCRMQERVVSKTHALRIGLNRDK